MKILALSNLYPPDQIGGYEVGCCQVVDALLTRGHEVQVLTSTPRTPVSSVDHVKRLLQLTDVYDRPVQDKSVAVVRDLEGAKARWINAHNVHILTTTLEAYKPDVIYLWNLVGLGGLGLVACLRHLGIPWVWHLMDAIPTFLCSGNGVLPVLVREFNRQIHGTYLACSQRVVEEIESAGIILNGEVKLLPNWVTGPSATVREYFTPKDTLRIISAGQIGWQKGSDIIIESARRLRDSGHDNFVIDMYGKITDHSLPERIRSYQLNNHIQFRGVRPHSEILSLYREYDVLAFPTWEREPCAFAPLEASSQGCVPIITRTCGNAEWMLHGYDCLKIERSPEAMTTVLTDILLGRISLEQLSRRTREVVQSDFHLLGLLPRIEFALRRAAATSIQARGGPDEAYQLALLGEKLTRSLLQQSSMQGGLYHTLLSFARRFWPHVQQLFRPMFRFAEEQEAMDLENKVLRRRVATLEDRISTIRSHRRKIRKFA